MKELMWKLFARFVAIPAVADWIINRSFRTPYFNLEGYMNRWWLFNAYDSDQSKPDDKRHSRKYMWLPSVRIHHILREDVAPDPHDHPWDARTIILKGNYFEDRVGMHGGMQGMSSIRYYRYPGVTATLKYGEYHNITSVSDGGVWTMFFTWKYMGMWGFLVDGVKIPWREYVATGKRAIPNG